MRPLQAIGMGLVIVVLSASVGSPGYDPFPDPLGWLLVVFGTTRLPGALRWRPWLVGLAALAGVVSVPLWFGGGAGAFLGAEESLLWVLELPRVGFVLVLALAMSRAAQAGGDTGARTWWRYVVVAAALTAGLPPIVFGAGISTLAVVAAGVAIATILGCLVLCFAHSARPWLHPQAT